MTVKFVQF